jgi:hypothetical protein
LNAISASPITPLVATTLLAVQPFTTSIVPQSTDITYISGIIQQVIILRAAAPKPPSPIKPSALRPYRATILSPEQVHAQEQRAVSFFTTPVSSAGPSNSKPFLHYKLPQLLKLTPATVPITKRKASAEPEGSNPKRVNSSENTDGSNDKGKERKKADENGN